MRDHLRHFRRKHEARRSLRVPTLHRGERRRPVKRVVQLDGVKLRRVVRELLARRQPFRVETSFPSLRRESTRANLNFRFVLLLSLRHVETSVSFLSPTKHLTGEMDLRPIYRARR